MATYNFRKVTKGVLSNPSRHNVGVQWVFSPPVHSLPTVRISEYGGVPCYFGKNSILVRDNWRWDKDLIFN